MQDIFFEQNKNALNYFESTSSQVATICHPLSYLGITHFWYGNFRADKRYFGLGVDVSWKRHFYARDLFNSTNSLIETLRTMRPYEERSLFWDEHAMKNCHIFPELRTFGIGQTVSLFCKYEDFAEVFSFASSNDSLHIVDFYKKHEHILRDFGNFFKRKAQSLIHVEGVKHMAILENPVFSPSLSSSVWDEKISCFLNSITSEPFSVQESLLDQASPQEIQCLSLLA